MKQDTKDKIKTDIIDLMGVSFFASIIIFVGSIVGTFLTNIEPYFLMIKFSGTSLIISGIIWAIIMNNTSWWDSWKRVKGVI